MQEGRPYLSKRNIIFISILGAIMFAPLFVFRAIGQFDFWWWMSTNLLILLGISFFMDPEYRFFLNYDLKTDFLKKIFYGIISAIALYVVFYAGNYLSRLIFDFAGSGIQKVYHFKGDASFYRIGLLMLLVIGPGEELFWRGFLQRHYASRIGKMNGYIAATALYTAVHLLSGNLMLVVAALVAGLFWGWMYMKYNSMVMNIISHTVWDLAVFILIPFS